MKNALVIFNPVAGVKKWGNVKSIIQTTLKKEGYEYEWFETLKCEKQPLEQFKSKKFDRIIVSGGDGTVAEVSSFLIHNKIKTPLIILPQGSANILAVSLSLPLNLKSALLYGLRNKRKALDAMQINNMQYGMICTGCGYDTLIMSKTPRSLKRKIGAWAYLWIFIKTIFLYRSKPYKLTIDGKRHVVVAKTILIFNILPLGHLKISKPFTKHQIIPNDGLLNIYVINPRPIRDFFRFSRHLLVFQGKKISIKSKKKRQFQIDGDVFKGKTMQIEVIPKAINIVAK
ncbi:hypothetical protein JW758_03050 [Candidatus Peregrinibacteria bacterium]|nr:hypothetical protein [Candidatus Peregrinibacteria bacterium]